ncbi:MAG TPA: GntR family transcriptional regulator [Burkholderiales bacterium]|nr:GntR family transcriptional regulator [Burkholderiales bacterium]
MKRQAAGRGGSARELGSVGDTHSSLSQRVADELRRSILTGRYGVGERLVEERISGDLRVSRVPVREALRMLATEGLIELRPRRGAVVSALTVPAAREMIEVRATLEGLNARLAARHCDRAVLAELEGVLEQGNAAAHTEDLPQLVELNARYHDLLARAGANSVLGDMMRSLRDRTGVLFAEVRVLRARQSWDEHAAILKAVAGGDEDLAATLATRHVLNAGELYLTQLESRDAGGAEAGETDDRAAAPRPSATAQVRPVRRA